jgi:hypothetical protein
MPPIVHRWDQRNPTQWNELLRATSDVDVRGFGVLTIVVSADVNYYQGKYIQEMHFRRGNTLYNTGYVWTSSPGPIMWELSEI